MHYATHAVSPCLAIVSGMADSVSCLGSGQIAQGLAHKYGSPFAVETAHFTVRGQRLAFEVTRSLFETARQYIESFDVYGESESFEWARIEGEAPVVHVGELPTRTSVPDYACLLPEPIRRSTQCISIRRSTSMPRRVLRRFAPASTWPALCLRQPPSKNAGGLRMRPGNPARIT